VVSENHSAAPAVFREPLPGSEVNSSNRRRFRQYVFVANSGYRIRYPFAAGTTLCCAERESSRSWQASITEVLSATLRQFSESYYCLGSQIKVKLMILAGTPARSASACWQYRLKTLVIAWLFPPYLNRDPNPAPAGSPPGWMRSCRRWIAAAAGPCGAPGWSGGSRVFD
jgi:hypothetical protein